MHFQPPYNTIKEKERSYEKGLASRKKNDLPGRPEFYLELELNCL
jgi:hypothetical protein